MTFSHFFRGGVQYGSSATRVGMRYARVTNHHGIWIPDNRKRIFGGQV